MQKVVAITKKVGKDVGGFWLSTDSAKTWTEKTMALTGEKESVGLAQFLNPA